MISKRAAKSISSTPLVTYHFMCEQDPSVQVSSQMVMNFGTAENYLPDLQNVKKIKSLNSLQQITRINLHYNQIEGPLYLRKTIAGFAKQFFHVDLDVNNITVCSAGVTAMLQILSYVLMDEKDKVVLLGPFYSAYVGDLTLRFNCKPITCDFFDLRSDNKNFYELQQLFKSQKPKVLIFNNPVNPTGHVWQLEQMSKLIDLCQKYQVQIIADQIYGMMCFDKSFHSILSLNRYKEHIHWCYGLAKDFGLAGFKVGFAYTANQQINQGIKAAVYFHMHSTITDKIVNQILGDFDHCKKIFAQQREVLRKNFPMIKKQLNSINIEVTQCQGGLFCLISLKKYGIDSLQKQMKMVKQLIQNAKLYITPGTIFGNPEGGWFRLCFGRQPKFIEEGLKRIIKFFKAKENSGKKLRLTILQKNSKKIKEQLLKSESKTGWDDSYQEDM